jgi:transcriptional regulator with XRE-family HTH domain
VTSEVVSQFRFNRYRPLRVPVRPAIQFGSLVRSVRKSKKLKIWQVAEKVGIEVKHLGRIERGERQPSFDLIVSLAKSLDVSPSTFFDFDSLADTKIIRTDIDRLLSKLEGEELRKVHRVLSALF